MLSTLHLRAAASALEAALVSSTTEHHDRSNPGPEFRFVTISRQAGAGGKTLAKALAAAVNAQNPKADPWLAWDQELTEKVAREHHLAKNAVATLETAKPHWFSEFLSSFANSEHPDLFKLYRRSALTIHALAVAGRAIIVGRGGVFITEGLKGGLHLRLVAPLEYRISHMADRLNVSPKEAAATVHEIDRNRDAFYHRYWPGKNVHPETFTLTLNTGLLTEQQMVACLTPLLREMHPAPNQATAEGTPLTGRQGSYAGGGK